MAPDRKRAERIILEILRQSSDGLGRVNLYKVFWLAHLYYARTAKGYLTDWPIVRMPNGPGIDRGERLIGDLVESGLVAQEHQEKGPFVELHCKLTGKPFDGDLPAEAVDSIRKALEFLKSYDTTPKLSKMSHDYSRSWREKANGQELDIYTDMLPDDEFEGQKRELEQLKPTYENLFE